MPSKAHNMAKTHPAAEGAPDGPRDFSRRSYRRSSRHSSRRSSRRRSHRSHRSHRRSSVQVGHRADAGRDVVALVVGYDKDVGARWLCARLSGGRGMPIKEIVQNKLSTEIQTMVAQGEDATVEVAYGNGAPGSVMPGIEGDGVTAKERLMKFASGGEFNIVTNREYKRGKMEARILLIILPEATKVRNKTGTLPTPPGYNIPLIRDRVALRQVSMVNATDAMLDASDKPVYVLYDMYDVQQESPGKYKFVDVHTGSLRRDPSLSVSLLIQQALRDMGVSLAGRSDMGKLTPYFVSPDGKPTLIGDDAAQQPCPPNVRLALLNTRANDVYNEVGIPFPAKPTFVPRDSNSSSDVVGGVVAYGGMVRKAPRVRDAYRGVNLTKYRFCLHNGAKGIAACGTIVGIPSMTTSAFREQGFNGFQRMFDSDTVSGVVDAYKLYVNDGESWSPVPDSVKLRTFPSNAQFCWSTQADPGQFRDTVPKLIRDHKQSGKSLVILTTSASASKGVMFSVQTDWAQSSALRGCIVTKAGTSVGVLQRAIRAVVDGAWEFALTSPRQFPQDLNGVSDLTSKPHCVAGAVLQTQDMQSTKWLLLLSAEAYKDLVLFVSRTGRMWRKQNPPVEGAVVPIRRTSIRVLDIVGVGDSVNVSASLFAVNQDSDLQSLVGVLQERRGDGHVTEPKAVLVGLYATTSAMNDTPIAVVGTGVVDVDRAVKNSLDISTVPFKRLEQVQLGDNYDNHVIIIMDAGAVAYYKRRFTVDGKAPRDIGTPMVYIPPAGFVSDVLNGIWDAQKAKQCGDNGMMRVSVELVSAERAGNSVFYNASVPRGWALRTLAEASAHACQLDKTKQTSPPDLYKDAISVSRIMNKQNGVTYKQSEFDTQLQAVMSWGNDQAQLILYPQNTSKFINYYVFSPCAKRTTPPPEAIVQVIETYLRARGAGGAGVRGVGVGVGAGNVEAGGEGGGRGRDVEADGEGGGGAGAGGGGGDSGDDSSGGDASGATSGVLVRMSDAIDAAFAPIASSLGSRPVTKETPNSAHPFSAGDGSSSAKMCRAMGFKLLTDEQLNEKNSSALYTDSAAPPNIDIRTNTALVLSTLGILYSSTAIEGGVSDDVSAYSAYVIGISPNSTEMSRIIWSGRAESAFSLHQIGVLEQGSALVLVHDDYVPDAKTDIGKALSNFTIVPTVFAADDRVFTEDAAIPVLVPKIMPNKDVMLKIANTVRPHRTVSADGRIKPVPWKALITSCRAQCIQPDMSGMSLWQMFGEVLGRLRRVPMALWNIRNAFPEITTDFRMCKVVRIIAERKAENWPTTSNEDQYEDVKTRWTVSADEAKKPPIEVDTKKKTEGELVISGTE